MAHISSPSIRLQSGDEPKLQMIASMPFVSLDGEHEHGEITAMSLTVLEHWADSLLHQIVLQKTRAQAEATSDNDYDAVIGL